MLSKLKLYKMTKILPEQHDFRTSVLLIKEEHSCSTVRYWKSFWWGMAWGCNPQSYKNGSTKPTD